MPVCICRFLFTLKKYVRNKARPEGSIAEAYINAECLTFCSMYLDDVETKFNRVERNADRECRNEELAATIFRQNVRPLGGAIFGFLDLDELAKAHDYVLNNCDEVDHYIE